MRPQDPEATFRLAWECARPNATVTVALYDKAHLFRICMAKNLHLKPVEGWLSLRGNTEADCRGRLDTEPLLIIPIRFCKIEEAYELFENKKA